MDRTDRVFDVEELAARYKTSPETLRTWRYQQKGPRWFRAGKKIMYREAAVLEWERSQEDAATTMAS